MRRPPAILFLALGALAAGCFGSDGADDDDDVPSPPPRLAGIGLRCPPGATTELVAGICVGTLQRSTESLQEPFVAHHPFRNDVVAIGVNGGESTSSGSSDGEPAAAPIRLHVYVTEDGGATWRLSRLPDIDAPHDLLPTGISFASDPTLGFDAEGRLHVAGMYSRDITTRGYEVFHASSDDLGRTWNTPTVLTTDENNDRPWQTVAEAGLFLAWHNFDASSGAVVELAPTVARSTDRGVTWSLIPPSGLPPACRGAVPPMAVLNASAYLACAHFDGPEFSGVDILRLGAASASFEVVASLPRTYLGPRFLVATASATLLFVGGNDANLVAATSEDEGATWTPADDLRKALSVEDGWQNFIPAMAAPDSWGGVHLLVRDLNAGTCSEDVPTFRDCTKAPIAYVVLRERDLAVLHQIVLTPADPTQPAREPPTLARAWADDYLGTSFAREQGMIVWTRDRGLDFTVVLPVFEPIEAKPN